MAAVAPLGARSALRWPGSLRPHPPSSRGGCFTTFHAPHTRVTRLHMHRSTLQTLHAPHTRVTSPCTDPCVQTLPHTCVYHSNTCAHPTLHTCNVTHRRSGSTPHMCVDVMSSFTCRWAGCTRCLAWAAGSLGDTILQWGVGSPPSSCLLTPSVRQCLSVMLPGPHPAWSHAWVPCTRLSWNMAARAARRFHLPQLCPRSTTSVTMPDPPLGEE